MGGDERTRKDVVRDARRKTLELKAQLVPPATEEARPFSSVARSGSEGPSKPSEVLPGPTGRTPAWPRIVYGSFLIVMALAALILPFVTDTFTHEYSGSEPVDLDRIQSGILVASMLMGIQNALGGIVFLVAGVLFIVRQRIGWFIAAGGYILVAVIQAILLVYGIVLISSGSVEVAGLGATFIGSAVLNLVQAAIFFGIMWLPWLRRPFERRGSTARSLPESMYA